MRFDIILPTVVRGSLFNAIESVCQQAHTDWTLWVVQDGTYAPDLLVQAFPHTNIRFVHKKCIHKDSGASARNHGISLGDANWIAYIDDDDEWHPNHLAVHARMIENNPGVSMVRTAGQSFFMKHKHPRSSKLVRKMGPINTTDILTVGMSHTRELFEKTSGWKPEDNHDHLLWNEMLAKGGKSEESEEVTFLFKR